MPKKLINFTERQVEHVAREAERLGISFTELVRRILDTWISQRRKKDGVHT